MTKQIDYARLLKADASQIHVTQLETLVSNGVDHDFAYGDPASVRLDKRPWPNAWQALRRARIRRPAGVMVGGRSR